jgi:glycosyltransferase involved in cell wall biosynthesis
MKILQLCNKIPFPPLDGGAIAMLNISKSLTLEGHEVVILAMNTKKHGGNVNNIPEHLSSCIKFQYVPVDTSIRPLQLLVNFLFSRLPYNAERFNKVRFSKALNNLLSHESFDIIQLEGLYLKPYISLIRKLHRGSIVYRAHNIENEIWHSLAARSKNPLKKYYLHNLAKRIKQYETDFINQYDLLLPITNQDLAVFRTMGNTKPAQVIPTGVLTDAFREVVTQKAEKSIFFIGALDWLPNQEGLLWFINTVWPGLKENKPAPVFHVAGRNAPQWLEKKCIENAVVFYGEVSDAHQFIDENDIMVVPLFAGSGIRVKIIEAMARSKVVVTTPIGAQGLNIQDSIHAVVTEDALAFRLAVERFLNDHCFYQEVQKNAYTFAQQNFSNDRIIKTLVNFFNQNIAC